MPETTAQRSEAARKRAATRKAHELEREQEELRQAAGAGERSRRPDLQLSGDVLKSLESGSRAAIEAVRRFIDVVDEALPAFHTASVHPAGERSWTPRWIWPTDSSRPSMSSCEVLRTLGLRSAERKTRSRARRAPAPLANHETTQAPLPSTGRLPSPA